MVALLREKSPDDLHPGCLGLHLDGHGVRVHLGPVGAVQGDVDVVAAAGVHDEAGAVALLLPGDNLHGVAVAQAAAALVVGHPAN